MSGDEPTLHDLWELDYAAFTADQADAQADRQIEPYAGRTLQWNGEGSILFEIRCTEWACRDKNRSWRVDPVSWCPHMPAAFRVRDGFLWDTYGICTPGGGPLTIKVIGTFGAEAAEMWDDEVAYPRWEIEVLDPEVMFTKNAMGSIPDEAFGLTIPTSLLWRAELEVPGIGIIDGEPGANPLVIWPLESDAA